MKNRSTLTLILLCLCFVVSPVFTLMGCSSNVQSEVAIIPPTDAETEEDNLDDSDGNAPDNDGDSFIESSPPPDTKKTYVRSKVDGLNIRSAKSASSIAVGSINKNDMVPLLGTENGWYKTTYKGKTAYLSASSAYTELYKVEKSASDKIEKVMEIGEKYLGTKYVYGATRLHNGKGKFLSGFKDTAFDCSSFVQYAYYYGADVLLNLTTRTQVSQGQAVNGVKNMKRGDLMFFTNAQRYYNTGVERIGHVAIYLGDNYILHTAYDYAVIEPISTTRWNYLLYIRRHV